MGHSSDDESSHDQHKKHDKHKKKKNKSESESDSESDSSSDDESYIRGYKKGKRSGKYRPSHWEYEGPNGPQNWHTLKPAYAIAKEGKQQSPIDLTNASESDGVDVSVSYKPSSIEVINNGHTIQVYFFILS